MRKKKLMVLGAGQCQVPIIQQAQKMGFAVIAVSIGGNYPGLSIADKFYEIDVRAQEKILEVAAHEKIDGILTDQTDIPVPSVAYVAEKLGLPGIGSDCAQCFTNKYRMRQYCDQLGIPVPRHVQADSWRQALQLITDFCFPLVLKPVDSQGSRGVVRVGNGDELRKVFDHVIGYSVARQVIVEEFIQGREVVVEGFKVDGKFLNLVIGDRRYFDLPNMFIPRQTLFPSTVKPELQQKILKLNERLIKGFDPRFGITHSEYLVNEETGDIRLVETAIRGGGVFISSDLIPLASNVDANQKLIKLATDNGDIALNEEDIAGKASAYLCFYLPVGRIHRMHGVKELREIAGVHAAYLDDIAIGGITSHPTDKTMRKGPILIAADDRPGLEKIIEEVRQTLIIEVSTSDGLKGIIW
jgi:carbamoyl-phosphate synthase large subunit